MIERLRRKFIYSALLSISLILVCIITALYGLNLYQMERRTDELLEYVYEYKDGFPAQPQPPFKPVPEDQIIDTSNGNPINNHVRIDAETPFRTRYFTVHYDNDGNYLSSYLNQIASVSETVAISYGASALLDSDGKGRIDVYKYIRTTNPDGTDCIFLDISEDLDNLKRNLLSSVIVSLISVFILYVLIWIISGKVIRPYARYMELQKRFITDAGHELKTPLAIISANTEVVEMTAGQSEWTTNIRSQVTRMTELIQRLLVLSRMEEDDLHYHFSDFSLTETASKTAAPFLTLAHSLGKNMIIDIPDGLSCHADERSICELISILCDNAVKYCDEGGTIRLTLRNIGKKNRITVSNTCLNAENADLDSWFGRFYRDDASRSRDTGGFGIGLSIAYAIAQAHKGRIDAEYENGNVVIVAEI